MFFHRHELHHTTGALHHGEKAAGVVQDALAKE